MTTRGIENQYAAYDEIVADINRICDKLTTAIDNEDIELVIAALCTVLVDSAHQLEMPSNDRAELIRSAMIAAWKDYYSSPPISEQH